ncbi:MAG TPA: acyl-ACP--UDP-N-acetylglucosamine O-acyltransferase [Tepidisphaeraceae bacterium]|nr:acyl-ACP--UDP-N-acetylglucosamine O-acyltransferase [Tepidisphaeraceae bacterium]
MSKISPLAVVDPSARVADDVEIGPFCTVGPDVEIGPGNRLISHVVITGHTTVGECNTFHPFAVIGGSPQDKKFRGEVSRLIVGSRNTVRESVTIHVGTALGGGVTRVGDGNLLMVNSHIGHDSQVGSNCVIANNVMLAGHVNIGNYVVMSGGAACHHFVTIGDYAFIAGMARIHHDVPPYVMISDNDRIRAINAEGLRRARFNDDEIDAIDEAARRLFFNREKTFAAALAEFDTMNGLHPYVKTLVEFLRRRDIGKHGRYLEGLRLKKSYNSPPPPMP